MGDQNVPIWEIERDEAGRAARMVMVGYRPAKGVTPPVGPQDGNGCEICGKPKSPRSDFWCSRRCKDKAYNAAHPVSRQARLDFTPAASDLAHAVRGRETKAQKILARLKEGPANSLELLRVGGIRYSARVFELRKQGHRIETEEHAEWAVYRLEE